MQRDPIREALRLMDDPEQAIAFLESQPADLLERDSRGAYAMGLAHYRLTDDELAEEWLEHAISLDPESSRAFYYLGLTLRRQGRADEAAEAVRTAAELDPGYEKATTTMRRWGIKPRRQLRTDLDLPDTDEEFIDYARRRRLKARIDQRESYSAQLNELPWFVKGLMVLIVLAVLAIFVMGYLNFSGFQSESEDEFCRAAAEQGIDHPACP